MSCVAAPKFVGGLALSLCGLLLISGCQERSTVRPVSGRITLNGKPLADASISFQPVVETKEIDGADGMGSYGRTNDEGQYTLKLVDTDQSGALIGTHVVRISIVQRGMADDEISMADNALPLQYRDGSARFEVKADGENIADFDLKSR